MHIYIYVCMYVCIYIYIYIYAINAVLFHFFKNFYCNDILF